MELIDKDALNERMYHDAFETDSDMQKWDGGCWIRYKMFENAIKDAPTIEERKTGRWIKNDNGTYSCSICQSWIPEEQHFYARYCLYCGADMREGVQDGET